MALKNLNVVIGADTTGFQKGVKNVQGGITKMKGGLSSLIKGGLALAGVTVGLKAIGDSMKAYVGLESSVSRVNGLFGDASKYVQYFAENTAKGFGMAESSAYQYAAVYGNLFKNITSSTEENAKVTIAMMKASSVVASKTGRTMEDVMERIRSGLLGNTESIEDLGINVNVAMLETTGAFKKIANGRTWEQLNFYEQQQVRTLGILEQAHTNFGDSVQQGSAFSLSVLSGAFKDLQTTAGAFINKALAPVVSWLTQVVQWATSGLKAIAALLGINVKGDLSGASTSLTTGATGAEDMADGLSDSAKNAKKLQNALAGFDQFNDITKTADSSSKSGGGAGGTGGGASVFDSLPGLEFGEMTGPDLTWVENAKATLEPTILSFQNLWIAMDPFRTFIAQGAIDFYNNFLVPVGVWVMGEGLPGMIDSLSVGFASVSWETINTGLNNLWTALTPFAINVGEGLLWFWDNVLVPIGVYAVNDLLPLFLDSMTSAVTSLDGILKTANPTIRWIYDNALVPFGAWLGNDIVPLFFEWFKAALEIFESIAKAAQPTILWLWDNLLNPIASWTGGLFQSLLEGITGAFKGFSEWAKNNQKTVDTMFAAVTAFFAGMWIYNSTKNLISFCKDLFLAFKTLATGVTLLGMASNFANIGFGLLAAAIVLIAMNWSKMSGIDKTTSVLGAIAIAAAAAAAAVGALQSAWSLGLAAAAIVGGIAAIAISIKAANRDSQKALAEYETPDVKAPNFQIPSFALAKGGVAYGEVQALVGDNFNAQQDPEVISPLSTLKGMIVEALMQKEISTGGNKETRLILTLENGETLADMLIDPINKKAKNMGYAPVFKPAT